MSNFSRVELTKTNFLPVNNVNDWNIIVVSLNTGFAGEKWLNLKRTEIPKGGTTYGQALKTLFPVTQMARVISIPWSHHLSTMLTLFQYLGMVQ